MSFLFPVQSRKSKPHSAQSCNATEREVNTASSSNAPGRAASAVKQSHEMQKEVEATTEARTAVAEEINLLVTFPSVHHALKLERAVKVNPACQGCQRWLVSLMPVPRQISSSCGLAARVCMSISAGAEERGSNEPVACHALTEKMGSAGVEYEGIYLPASGGQYELLVEHDDGQM